MALQVDIEHSKVTGKAILEDLRKSMGVPGCIKMMFFGSVPGLVKGSGSFMAMLESEG